MRLLELLTYCGILGLTQAFLTFIWFQTTFVLEYGKLFGLARWLKEEEWERYKDSLPEEAHKYPYFLKHCYHNWLTSMLGCPFCFIGFSSLLVAPFIVWWGWGVSSFVASGSYLFLMSAYKYVYSEKN